MHEGQKATSDSYACGSKFDMLFNRQQRSSLNFFGHSAFSNSRVNGEDDLGLYKYFSLYFLCGLRSVNASSDNPSYQESSYYRTLRSLQKYHVCTVVHCASYSSCTFLVKVVVVATKSLSFPVIKPFVLGVLLFFALLLLELSLYLTALASIFSFASH